MNIKLKWRSLIFTHHYFFSIILYIEDSKSQLLSGMVIGDHFKKIATRLSSFAEPSGNTLLLYDYDGFEDYIQERGLVDNQTVTSTNPLTY